SLRRLKTDYIDLYQFHLWGFPAEKGAPIRDTLETLVSEGKIRGYGWRKDVGKIEVCILGNSRLTRARNILTIHHRS
ncbi:MAG TPA: aldo/keto reductase, partial [Aggregatilineaceae bacterium]|nr:aldo/keto reductase [Aggregatilineaceae bacterium]